jgi:phage terminase large subunit
MPHRDVVKQVQSISEDFKFTGMDFGFETSYNAVVRCAVDDENKILYVYDEYYKNKMTDVETAEELEELGYKDELITADSEDPKAIRYYVLSGFQMRPCKKYNGSRLGNTRKIKRFKSIVISSKCTNCWRELKNLTYKKDANGDLKYDEFNIDPHTFSAIWYALDLYDVADVKYSNNSRRG